MINIIRIKDLIWITSTKLNPILAIPNKEYNSSDTIFNFYYVLWKLSMYLCIPIEGSFYSDPNDFNSLYEIFILQFI